MKKIHGPAVKDIFYGDEHQHDLADRALLENYEAVLNLDPDDLPVKQLALLVQVVMMEFPAIALDRNALISRLENNPEFRDFVKKCFKNKDYRSIRNMIFTYNSVVTEDSRSQLQYDPSGQSGATVLAWNQPYVGEAHQCLYDVMLDHLSKSTAYGRFLSIVQSSGTGKSRMVDELSRTHLVVPINLRPRGENGFPAADAEARDFLDEGKSPSEADTRCAAFFIALFQQLLTHFQNIDHAFAKFKMNPAANNCDTIAAKFRFLMTHNQSYVAPNSYRAKFYQQVCKQAQSLVDSQSRLLQSPQFGNSAFEINNPPWPTIGMAMTAGEPVTGSSVTAGVFGTPITEVEMADESVASGSTIPDLPRSPVMETIGKQITGSGEEAPPTIPPIAGGTNIRDVARDLIYFLNPELKSDNRLDLASPVIILAFDEAHRLTEVQNGAEKLWSRFGELRRNIRQLRSLPIFSLFISTVSKTSDFTSAPKQDISMRVMDERLTLLPPFTEIGFDQLRRLSPIKDNTVSIQEAATDEFMCQFGRPLFGTRFQAGNADVQEDIVQFAASKLICGREPEEGETLDEDQKLACMAVRLALEFNSTTSKSQQRERLQVAKHMRVCITVNKGYETIVSVAPSEPILAEGARYLMRKTGLNLPRSLLKELERPGLDKGSRGELICLILLLLAGDRAAEGKGRVIPVQDFFQSLLNSSDYAKLLKAKPTRQRSTEEGKKTFEEAFAKSRIYFNHFVKIDDPCLVNRKFLWMMIARGAAILCANNQAGIDVLVPFTYYDTLLGQSNVSAILIQVKNDRRFSTSPKRWLFDGMDPYRVPVHDAMDEHPLPVIRMVFALSSTESGVTIMEPEVPRYSGETKATTAAIAKTAKVGKAGKKSKKLLAYTSYDIWCAGAFATTFAVIDETEENTYKELLEVCNRFPLSYGSQPVESLRRSMNPATMAGVDHWLAFDYPGEAGGKSSEETDEDMEEDIEMS